MAAPGKTISASFCLFREINKIANIWTATFTAEQSAVMQVLAKLL
jgi:hypothetical protein